MKPFSTNPNSIYFDREIIKALVSDNPVERIFRRNRRFLFNACWITILVISAPKIFELLHLNVYSFLKLI